MSFGMNVPTARTGGNVGNTNTGNLRAPGIYRQDKPNSRSKIGDYRVAQEQIFTPEQQQLFSQLFSQVGPESYLSRLAGGDEALFNEIEAPAFRQFNEQLGGLASRFSGMGMGGRHSSGFQNTATQAGSNFAQDLASRRQALQRQAILDLMGISSDLLGQRPSETMLVPKKRRKPGFWDLVGQSFAEDLGHAAGSFVPRNPLSSGGGGGGAGGGIDYAKLASMMA
jgi:hypothetical protein